MLEKVKFFEAGKCFWAQCSFIAQLIGLIIYMYIYLHQTLIMVYLVKLIHFTGLDAAATDSNDI